MKKPKKKPYSKPAIDSEKVVETATLACGKCMSGPSGVGTPPCKAVKKFS